MPMGMDDDEWLERENDKAQEEEGRRNQQSDNEFIAEQDEEARHQARIDDGYYNEFDD